MTPEAWAKKRLGELFIDSKARGKPGLPTLSVTMNDGLVSRDALDRKMETNLDPDQHLLVRKGDLAYNMMRMWQGASGLAAVDGMVSPAYVVLRAGPDIDPQFAAYLFKLPRMIYLFWAYSHGMTEDRLRLYFDDFALIPIDLPPIEEQRQIVEILSTWDRAIETVDALVANTRKHKAAVLKALLTGARRLPGFEGEWRDTPISRMGTIISGGTPDSTNPAYWDGDIAWATPTDITKLRTPYISRTDRFITAAGLSSSAAKLLPAGTVIVCTRASVGILAIATVPIATNQGFKNIVPNQNYDSTFLYYLLSLNGKALVRAAGGSTFLEVSKADFERLIFRIPAIDEQRAIASVLSSADEAQQKLESTLAALREEKAALMQQLLTGKRRVKLAECEAA